MATYRLTYWKKRGRGEQIRLLLAELDQPYEDVHVGGDTFHSLQSARPSELYFGSVPMLEDGDFRLCQGCAIMSYLARKHGIAPHDSRDAARADAIALGAEDLRSEYFRLFGDDTASKQERFVHARWRERWLPSFDALLEQNGGAVFAGGALSHADIAVWDAIDAVTTWVAGATLDEHPRVGRFFAAIKERPRIAAYLASDRRPTG